MRQADEAVCERLARSSTGELFFADRFPEGFDDFDRIASDLLDRQFEVFCPQAQARLEGEGGIVADEVHLGVVEERVLVQVRRADREPGVVDDPDLRMDVNRVCVGRRAGIDGAGEDPAGVGVGFDQLAEHSARVVAAAAWLRRQQHDDAEVR